MRTKKIRGQKRRWKDIDSWVENHKYLDIENLEGSQRDYTKILVRPWSDISMLNSIIPEPKRETRSRMLHGLVDIYNSWKKSLDQLDAPYYLKIWLFEPEFSRSQVVCAIGDFLNFYETTFFKPERELNTGLKNIPALEGFNWEYRLDEDHMYNSDIGSPEDFETISEYEENKTWFTNKMKRPHRTVKLEEPYGEATEYYSFKKGVVWIGQK